MTTKYIEKTLTDDEIAAEKVYIEKNTYYGDLYMINDKRKKMISKVGKGTVLEIASGCLQTLEYYAKSNNDNGVSTIVFTEPGDMQYRVGMRSIVDKLDKQPEVYSGSYEKVENIIHPTTKQPVEAWKIQFTEVKGKDADVPLNIPLYYAQADLDSAGPIATQLLGAETKVDTVVSSFGVCYVCCSIHPLDYLHKLQIIFGPKKSDNQYQLCMLEHGQTQHPDVIPAENQWVKRDGGVEFRHLFELMADSRLIIKDMQHVNETKQTEGPFNTFHIYQCEPNSQDEWVKKQQQ